MQKSVLVWGGVLGVLLAVGWSLVAGGKGTAEGAADAVAGAQLAQPVRALEVISDRPRPTTAQPDAQGRLWVLQKSGDRLTRREPDGRWTVVIGQGPADFDFDPDIDVRDGSLARNALVHWPDSIALAPDGTVYVADTGYNRIRAIDPATQRIRTVAGDGSTSKLHSLPGPESLQLTPDGALWLVSNKKVYRLVPETGQLDLVYNPERATPQWGVNKGSEYLSDLAADAQGRIYVADNGNMRLLRLDAWSGAAPADPRQPAATVLAGSGKPGFLSTDVPALQSPMGLITGLAMSPEGQLYLYEGAYGRLVRLDERSGRFVTVLRPETPVVAPGQAPVTMDLYPQRLRAGAKGVLYFPDENHSRVLALTP